MKSEILAKLIRKLGGDPTGATNKNQLLDKLCECEIGGGESPFIVVHFTRSGEAPNRVYGCEYTYNELIELLESGNILFAQLDNDSTIYLFYQLDTPSDFTYIRFKSPFAESMLSVCETGDVIYSN